MLDVRFTIPAAVVIVPAVIAVSVVLLRARRRRLPGRTVVAQVALTSYPLLVIAVTLFPLQVVIGRYAAVVTLLGSLQWVPIVTIDATTFLLNILMFVPFGVLLPLATRLRTVRSVTAAAAAASLSIEIAQLASQLLLNSGRVPDVNDVIANTLGALVGLVLLRVVRGASRAPIRSSSRG